jgi:uracil-DNA glycosylase
VGIAASIGVKDAGGPQPEPQPEPGHRYPELPERQSLAGFREAAAHCRACDLWTNATQTVFGEGRRTATVVFVGEQPGDKEDIAGRPFVGPAGRILDEGLEAAGIDRGTVYVTNAVERFTPLHARAGARALAGVGHR